MTRIEIRVLKGLCGFEVCSHVENRFFPESVTFVHFRVQERSFCFRDFSREFDRWVKTVSP